MNRASVFCVPSVIAASGDSEGFGMVFLESQSMGLPVVSFSTGGIPEAVEHGITGFLAPPKDDASLAGHIAQLLTSRETWTRLSGAGRERVRREFDVYQQTKKLERIYSDLLAFRTINRVRAESLT
jgi:glycosyltransferase involved in cell wall biosynthesis